MTMGRSERRESPSYALRQPARTARSLCNTVESIATPCSV